MAKRKTISEASANLEAAIGYIPERYKAGVAGADWQTPASSDAAEANFATAMQAAIAAKSRQAGIRNTPNSVWQNGATTKGFNNIGQGIRNGLGAYRTNFAPVLDAMNNAAASAPARSTDWRTNINNRLIPVVQAAINAAK